MTNSAWYMASEYGTEYWNTTVSWRYGKLAVRSIIELITSMASLTIRYSRKYAQLPASTRYSGFTSHVCQVNTHYIAPSH